MQNPGSVRIVPIRHASRQVDPKRGAKHFEISGDELSALRQWALLRRRRQAATWIESHIDELRVLNPHHPHTPEALWLIAQWSDVEDNAARCVDRLCAAIPPASRIRLPLSAYLYLRLTDDIRRGEASDLTLKLAAEAAVPPELTALIHFSWAQILRAQELRPSAIEHAAKAAALASEAGYTELAAAAQSLEALASMERDIVPRAVELLRNAESILSKGEEWLWLGRAQAALGWAALHEGQYERASEYFLKALLQFSDPDSARRDWAEATAALGCAKRSTASQIARNLDRAVQARRRAVRGPTEPFHDGPIRQRVTKLRAESEQCFCDAIQAFGALQDARTQALCRLGLGELRASCGDLDGAAEEGDIAFAAGDAHQDVTVVAEARLLHSSIELARFEEGIGSDPATHMQRAHDYAANALILASGIDARLSHRRRLLARAHVHLGSILASDYFNNVESATEHLHRAGEYLRKWDRDEVYEQHQALSAKVLRSGGIDGRLKSWSQGLVENRTFQQMTEEFAELVIPRIWLREGQNTSRVVAKLSISPKKVRRILAKAGLKG